jgi:hypothetical protein
MLLAQGAAIAGIHELALMRDFLMGGPPLRASLPMSTQVALPSPSASSHYKKPCDL